MTVSDYPVTLVYGAYGEAGYTKEHPHRGRDYGCPTGTPLVVGGRQIGLSGATGKVTGPHCHIQEWKGDYATTREPSNAFHGGRVTNIDPTGTQGDGSFGKFITILTSDGWSDTYCHLSRIDVKVDDIIGGEMPYTYNEDDFYKAWRLGFQREPLQPEASNPSYRDPKTLNDTAWNNGGKENYEATNFSEGDRHNFANALYGKDDGQGKDQVNKRFKDGAYGMVANFKPSVPNATVLEPGNYEVK